MNPHYLVAFYIKRRLHACVFLFVNLFLIQTVLAQPSINSFSPSSGPMGTAVTISGTNFSAIPSANIVYFGAARATVLTASATSLSVAAPATATYQPITVTVNGLTASSARPFIVMFAGGGNIIAPSFAARLDFATDLHPEVLVAADFDGDGKTDLASSNYYNSGGPSASISVLRNTGTAGTIDFAPRVDLPAKTYTFGLAAGDLNGDGKPDLAATSSSGTQTVSVFLNTSSPGVISFASKVDYATGTSPAGVAIADVDGDGRLDLIVADFLSGTVSLFQNTSSGSALSFAPKVDVATGQGPYNVAMGDLDGDGKPDLAVTNSLSRTMSIFLNTGHPGTIAFAGKVDIATTSGSDEPNSIAIADLDGDGKPDLVIGNNNINSVNAPVNAFAVFRNTCSIGAVSFGPPVNYYSGNAGNISVGDLNGDGKPDLMIPGFVNPNGINVYQNTSVPGTISLSNPVGYAEVIPYGPVIADLDGDGRPDLAIGTAKNTAAVFRNKLTEPSIIQFNPMTAAAAATVTITGVNLLGVTKVSFGGTPAASFTVVSDTRIDAVVGTGRSGDVAVTGPKGSGSMPGFVFAGAPVITSFFPASAKSGDTVTLVGANFSGAYDVKFGGTEAHTMTVVSPDTVIAVVGAGISGSVSITTPYGTASLPGFAYIPIPEVNAFSPLYAGPGQVVKIFGAHLTGATAVSFGGVAASSFTVLGDSTLSAVVGQGASGSVTVTTPFGQASVAGFTYYPPPVIQSFSPSSGFHGVKLTITGANFADATGVTVGGVDYSGSFTIVSPNTITLTLNYLGASGSIVVYTRWGTDSIPGFIFYKNPEVSAISPDIAGPGMTVTITGKEFTRISSVTLGGVPVRSFTVVSPDTITAIVDTGATGFVAVTNPAGSNINQGPPFIFTLRPLISSYYPLSGPVGTVVSISGSNFDNNDVVYIGGVRATILSANSGMLKVAVPAGAGYGPLTVTSPTIGLTGYSNIPFNVTFPVDTSAFNPASFAGHREFATGIKPTDVAVGDVDGDGKPDLVVVNFQSSSVSIYRNTSKPAQLSLAPRIDLSTGRQGARSIALADMDGDGRLDIVVGMGQDVNGGGVGTGLVIFRNIGAVGNLQFHRVNIKGYYRNDFMVVGDLDGDGKPDVAGADQTVCISCYNAYANISIYRNTTTSGGISFEEFPQGLNSNSAGTSITMLGMALGDLNGDGMPEIAIGTNRGGYVLVLKNTSRADGIYMNSMTYGDASREYSSNYMASPSIADLDGDGYPDIITSGEVIRNLGGLQFQSQSTNWIGGSNVPADLNGDGLPDIAYCSIDGVGRSSGSKLSLFKNTSTPGAVGLAAGMDYPALPSSKKIQTADLDGDGKPDIVVTNQEVNSISIFRNRTGEPLPPAPAILSFTPDSGSYATHVTITGTGFTQVTAVSFGGVPAASFRIVGSDTIIAVVDSGATGLVSVTMPGGTGTLPGFVYNDTHLPIISVVSPAVAAAGTTITLTGLNLAGATSVRFGQKDASYFTVASSAGITAVLDSATSDTIFVTTPLGTSWITGFTFIPTPGITAGDTVFCQGSPLLLTSSADTGNRWYRNSIPIPGAVADTLLVNSNGAYTVTTTVLGVASDTSRVFNVTFRPRPATPTITLNASNELVSSVAVGNQWYQDTVTAIAGATDQVFKPTASGNYSVVIIQDGCPSAFSDIRSFLVTAVGNVSGPDNFVQFAPNPVWNYITVSFDGLTVGAPVLTVEVFNMEGQRVQLNPAIHNGDRIDLSGLPKGSYILKALSHKNEVKAMVKILKLQ